jgi:hypothetical protein
VSGTSEGPEFLVRVYEHHDHTEYFLFPNTMTRAVELRHADEVEGCVRAWTAQLLGWSRFDVTVWNEYGVRPPASVISWWTPEDAEACRAKLAQKYGAGRVTVREVPASEYNRV